MAALVGGLLRVCISFVFYMCVTVFCICSVLSACSCICFYVLFRINKFCMWICMGCMHLHVPVFYLFYFVCWYACGVVVFVFRLFAYMQHARVFRFCVGVFDAVRCWKWWERL